MIYKIRHLICLFIFFSIVSSCVQTESSRIEIVNINNTVEKIIKAYIQSKPFKSYDSAITVSVHAKNDSIILSIANSYPDLHISKFRGARYFNKYLVSFVGEENSKFYTVNGTVKIPDFIIEKNNNMYKPNRMPPYGDPVQWIFYFKGDSIVDMYPKEKIEKFFSYKKLQSNE